MKRLLRILVGLLTGLSLLLCLASTTFWLRSYSTTDAWGVQKDRRYVLGSYRGDLYFERQTSVGGIVFRTEPHISPYSDQWELVRDAHCMTNFVSVFRHFPSYGTLRTRRASSLSWQATDVDYCMAPFWMVTLATAVAPALWGFLLIRRRRRLSRRRRHGLCLQCGYDLRATPDRCPECGTVAAEKKP